MADKRGVGALAILEIQVGLEKRAKEEFFRAMQSVENLISKVEKVFKQKISSLKTNVLFSVKAVTSSLMKQSQQAILYINSMSRKMVDWSKAIFDSVSTKIVSSKESIFSNFVSPVIKMLAPIGNILKSNFEDIKETTMAYFEFVKAKTGSFFSFFQKAGVSVVSFFQENINSFRDSIRKIPDVFVQVNKKMIEWKNKAVAVFVETKNTITKFTEYTYQKFSWFFKGLSLMQSGYQYASQKLKNTGSWLKGIFSSENHGRYNSELSRTQKILKGILALPFGILKTAFNISGIALIAGVLNDAKKTFTGLFSKDGGGNDTLFGTLSEGFSAAFDPISNELTRLAIMLLPMINDAIRPIVIAVRDMILDLRNFIALSQRSGGFINKLFITAKAIFVSFANIVTKLVDILAKSFFPKLMPALLLFLNIIQRVATDIIDAIGALADAAAPKLEDFFSAVMPMITDVLVATGDFIQFIVEGLRDFLPPLVDFLFSLLKDIIPPLGYLFNSLVRTIKALAPIVLGLTKIFLWLGAKVISPLLIGAIGLLVKGLGFLLNVFSFLLEKTTNIGRALWDLTSAIGYFFYRAIVYYARKIVDAFDWLWGKVVSFWESVKSLLGLDTVGGFFTGIAESIISGVSDMFWRFIDTLKGWWESVMNFFSIDQITSKIKGLADEWFPFAKGGIVTQPTKALIGEAGTAEMILPLDRESLRKVMPEMVNIDNKLAFPKEIVVKRMDELTDFVFSINKKVQSIDLTGNRPSSPAQGNFKAKPRVMPNPYGLGGF